MSRTSVFPFFVRYAVIFVANAMFIRRRCATERMFFPMLVIVRMTQLAVAFLDFSEFAERQPSGGNWVWQSKEISPFLDH